MAMEVVDFVHHGYVCDGSAYMLVRLKCSRCGDRSGWVKDRRRFPPCVRCQEKRKAERSAQIDDVTDPESSGSV